MNIEVQKISPSREDAKLLFERLDAHNTSHCPPEICYLTRPEELEAIDSVLLGVFCDGELCAMGGLKFFDGYAEVTRMYVNEDLRGLGLAVKLLRELESQALARNLKVLKLETSDKFTRAVPLYEKYGFTLCAPFGEYVSKAHNTYMTFSIVAAQHLEREHHGSG